MPNRLSDALSPYLAQHRDNPVDWYPWGEEVFEKAGQEGKPVFLSVGYSACHWCHVMAHESFEDPGVASIMNRAFVNVKVDREEHPDVDDAYMTFVQLLAGHGGWPMSVFMTPDRKPFFGGTYWPKEDRHGRPGFRSICLQIESAWATHRGDLEAAAEQYVPYLREARAPGDSPPFGTKTNRELAEYVVGALRQLLDEKEGGLGTAPKFPPHTGLELCLTLMEMGWKEKAVASEITEITLEKMALGGIHDHVGGGFHRYSTDRQWHVPHFEKMLYDNALLLQNFAHAAKVTGRTEFQEVAKGIVRWLAREMTSPEGAFYSALDADSEGEEGKFYVWSWDELMTLPEGRDFAEAYGCKPEGNFRDEATGRETELNILHAKEFQGDRFKPQLDRLLEMRGGRARPGLDDKVLVGWNGLMIAALARAEEFDMADRAAWAILDAERSFGRLPRMIVRGEPSGEAYLEDYACLSYAVGLLKSDELAGHGDRLCRQMVGLFADPSGGGFYSTSASHDVLFGRTKMYFDQPLPSPNAMALRAQLRLGSWQQSVRHIEATEAWILRAPHGTEALLTTRIRSGEIPVVSCGIAHFDGASGVLSVEIADGYHVKANPAAGEWLIPTSIEFEGISGRADYPPGDNGWYAGRVEIPFELDAPFSNEARVLLRYQVCSEDSCRTIEELDLTIMLDPLLTRDH